MIRSWLVVLVAGAGVLVGCGSEQPTTEATASDVEATAGLDHLTVVAGVAYPQFEGPPIYARSGEVRDDRSNGGWARHSVVIGGAQGEWRPSIELAGSVFEAIDGELRVVSGERQRPTLPLDQTIDIEVLVGGRDGLAVGDHQYRLSIPVWIDGITAETAAPDGTAPPDGTVELVLDYRLLDPADGPPVFTTESGLACPQDLFESGSYDYGTTADGLLEGDGHPTVAAAAAHYWDRGDGTYRGDRASLTEVIDGASASYDDENGNTLLVLQFVQMEAATGSVWVLSQSESCALS